ncbi:hypothetical protein BDR22DRAFT_892843 [Usnea florida]
MPMRALTIFDAEGVLRSILRRSSTKCASCDGRHRSGSSKCRVKWALAKCCARFPTAEDSPPLAMPSEEREDFNASSDSLAVNFRWRPKKKTPPNLAPAYIHTEAADRATLLPQPLYDKNPPIEDALESNKSARCEIKSTTEGFEPAPEPRMEERTNLAGKELEKRRGTSEDPAGELRLKKGESLTIEGLEKRRRISEEPIQKPRVKRKRELAGKQLQKRRAICENPARKPGVEKRRKVTRR